MAEAWCPYCFLEGRGPASGHGLNDCPVLQATWEEQWASHSRWLQSIDKPRGFVDYACRMPVRVCDAWASDRTASGPKASRKTRGAPCRYDQPSFACRLFLTLLRHHCRYADLPRTGTIRIGGRDTAAEDIHSLFQGGASAVSGGLWTKLAATHEHEVYGPSNWMLCIVADLLLLYLPGDVLGGGLEHEPRS
jgi:hypothetical protein